MIPNPEKSTIEINTEDGTIGIYHRNSLIYQGPELTMNQTLTMIRLHNITRFFYHQISSKESEGIERIGEFPDNLDKINI